MKINANLVSPVGASRHWLRQWREVFGDRDYFIESPEDWAKLIRLGFAPILDWPYLVYRQAMAYPCLTDTDLHGCDLSEGRLYDGQFVRANLEGAILNEANARESNFRRAKLNNASLVNFYAPLAILWGAEFEGASLTGADLRLVDAREADFRNAVLTGVDFSGATLNGANFSGAKLDGVVWKGASLCGASLDEDAFVAARRSGAYL